MATPSLIAPLLSRLAGVLNRNLEASTPGRALRAGLADRSFAVSVSGLGLRVRVAVKGSTLVLDEDAASADAQVSGAPLALLSLLRASAPVAGIPGITISGDPEVAQSFQKMLKVARPELEAELARRVGEAPAHLAARAASRALGLVRRLKDTTTHSIAEFLTEESRDLPARAEADQLVRGVDRLRDDVERAAARLGLLEERVRARPKRAC